MHFSSSSLLFSLLPSLISADQAPLGEKVAGWFDQAKAYIPNSVPSIPNPIDAGAAAVADGKVEKINIRNWERKLGPKLEGEEEWLILMTGGNKSCFGKCDYTNKVWNESVPLLSALPHQPGSPRLKLGRVDCEIESILCTAWATNVPAIYHFIFPEKPATGATPKSPLHYILLNTTTCTPEEISALPRASKGNYIHHPEYDGFLHPIDGAAAKYKFMIPLGWVVWGLGSTPSWLLMIVISFISRQMMGRRMANRPDVYGNRPAGAAAPAPALAPPAARPAPAAAPAGGLKSGGRKRK